jgi:hypothetical protein
MPFLLPFLFHTLAVIFKIRLPPHQRILQILFLGDQFLNLIRTGATIGRQRIRRRLGLHGFLHRTGRRREPLLREISIFMLFM